jgi:hypothetical protein
MRQRRTLSRAVLVLALAVPASLSQASRLNAEAVPHVRPASAAARQLIDAAARDSPTVRRLIEQVQQSDIFVYVQLTGSPQVPTASTTFTVATPRGRYLRILINAGTPIWTRTEMLAHELQHVLEIAAAPEVTGNDGIRILYERIGRAGQGTDRYETLEAKRIEALVRREIVRSHDVQAAAARR